MLYWFMWIEVFASAILFSKLFTFVFSVLNFVISTKSLSTTLLNFFKPRGTVFKLSTSKSSYFVSKLFKLLGTLPNLLLSSLSTSDLKAMKPSLAAKSDVLTPVSWSHSF